MATAKKKKKAKAKPRTVKRRPRLATTGTPRAHLREPNPKPRKSPKVRSSRINERERRFVAEYVACWDAGTAAIRAGYTKKSAQSTAYNLLKTTRVKVALDRMQKEYEKRVDCSKERILRELTKIAFADLSDYIAMEGKTYRVRNWDEIPPFARGAIQELIPGSSGMRIKLHSKDRALELLGKFHAMWVDRAEHSGPDGGAIKVYIPSNDRAVNGSGDGDAGQ